MASKSNIYARVLADALKGVSEDKAVIVVQNFKKILKKRGDLKLASQILQEFDEVWMSQKGTIARLVTASGLSDTAKKQTESSLKKKGFVLEERVDPAVIGGSAIFLGKDYMIDGTIRGRLKKFTRILKS
tara:strand:- start:49 stop:438 length:390 start_codon:yes stop_codon:yes gene_type:complete